MRNNILCEFTFHLHDFYYFRNLISYENVFKKKIGILEYNFVLQMKSHLQSYPCPLHIHLINFIIIARKELAWKSSL